MERWEEMDNDTVITPEYAHKFDRSGLCEFGVCVGSCSCKGTGIKVDYTKNVLTPYGYTKAKYNKGQSYNYDEYDLFALKTKILPHIQKMNSTWYPVFEPMDGGDKMVYNSVELYSGSTFVPTTDELYPALRKIVDDAIELFPGYCLLLHDFYPIMYKDVCLPATWISSILLVMYGGTSPECDEGCRDLIHGNYKYKDGAVYVKLYHGEDTEFLTDYVELPDEEKLEDESATGSTILKFQNGYSDRYYKLYFRLLDYLHDLYLRGSVVLRSPDNDDFIRNWQLRPFVKTAENINIYIADYRDTLLIPHPTEFLIRRLQGYSIVKYPLVGEYMYRAEEILKQEGYDYNVSEVIRVHTTNIDQVRRLRHIMVDTIYR